MGDGTKEKPLTREDVEKKIEEHGGPKELDLSGKTFVEAIDLSGLDLLWIILKEARFPTSLEPEIIEGVNLTGVHLEKADFKRAHLERADLYDTHLEGANLWHAHLERAYLWDTHLEETNLMGTHLEGVNLTRTKFSRDVRLEDVDWGNYILDEEKQGDFDSAVASYRHLKVWYTNAGNYDIAGEFFFREMEAKRKNLRWLQPQERKWLGWWPFRGQKVRLSVYRWIYGYGERPWRVVAWGLLVLVGFSLIYFLLRGVAPYNLTGEAFLSSLYYSSVSFTALGYGPWFSSSSVRGWVQGFGAAEAIIGVFMIALFLITFIRKMTR